MNSDPEDMLVMFRSVSVELMRDAEVLFVSGVRKLRCPLYLGLEERMTLLVV